MSLFFPTSSIRFTDLPIRPATQANDFAICIDQDGFTYKVEIQNIGNFVVPQSLSDLTFINSGVILGRYSSGLGEIQEIILGTEFSINAGVLNAEVPVTGTAGGDLEGSFPNPTIVDGAVTLSKLESIPSNSLIGRYSLGDGSPEVVQLGTGFTMIGNQLTFNAGSGSISDNAFLIENVTSDFIIEATKLYIVDGTVNLTATLNTLAIGEQFMIVLKNTAGVSLVSNNETVFLDPSIQKAYHYVSIGTDDYYDIL